METVWKVTFINPKTKERINRYFSYPPTIKTLDKSLDGVEDNIPVGQLPSNKENWQIVYINQEMV